MEKNQMKNIIVLKNLPSNLIEEAIVILKSKKNIKKIEYIEKKESSTNADNIKSSKDYIIREAESVISNYINVVEKKDKKKGNVELNKKYNRLKIYSIIATIAFLISLIL